MEEDDKDVRAKGADDEGGVRCLKGQEGAEGGPAEVDEGFQVVAKGSGKNSRQITGPATAAAKELIVFIRAKAGKRNLLKLNQLQLSKLMTEAAPGSFSHIHASGKECLKVYCENTAQKAKLLKVEALGDIPVDVSEPQKGYHREAVNQTIAPARLLRGVIKGVARDVSDEEIATETKVHKAIRIKKYVNGRQENTSAVLLVFHEDVIERPPHVFLGFFRIPVHEFHPTPTKCNVCQAYGHVGRSCRATTVRCAKCAGNHRADACTAQLPKCANCGGPHPAAYQGCPKFKVAKIVTNLAAKQGLSYAEAVRSYVSDQRKTAAAAARVAGGRVAGPVEVIPSGGTAAEKAAGQPTAGGPTIGGPSGGQAAAGGPTTGGPTVGGATAGQAAREGGTAVKPTWGPLAGGQAAIGLTAGAGAEAGGPTAGGLEEVETAQAAAPKSSKAAVARKKRSRGSSTDSTSSMRTKVQRGVTNVSSSESSEDEGNGDQVVKMTLDDLRHSPPAGSAPSRRQQRAAKREAAAAALASAEQAAATHMAAAEHARAQAAEAIQAAAAQAAALAAKTAALENMHECMQKICSLLLQLLQKVDLIGDDAQKRQMSTDIGEIMLKVGIFTEVRPL